MTNTTKTQTAATLSNGKTIVLGSFGWYQTETQRSAGGDLTRAETAEAWRLWDEKQSRN